MHEIFLKRAIDLAHKGKYLTKPNPMVGCVIVKDNEVIAEGHHMKYGSNHAEINALEDLNNNNISEAELDSSLCTARLNLAVIIGKLDLAPMQ